MDQSKLIVSEDKKMTRLVWKTLLWTVGAVAVVSVQGMSFPEKLATTRNVINSLSSAFRNQSAGATNSRQPLNWIINHMRAHRSLNSRKTTTRMVMSLNDYHNDQNIKQDDFAAMMPFTYQVAKERRNDRIFLKHDADAKLSSLALPSEIQPAASAITFGIGIGIGLLILLLIFVVKTGLSPLPSIAGCDDDSSSACDGSDTTSSKNISTAMGGDTNDSGSRTAILALYSRYQSQKLFKGPDEFASHLFPSVVEAMSSNTTLLLVLLSCRCLSNLNYMLTQSIFEDQISYLATVGNTGLVTPIHIRTCWYDDVIETFIRQVRQMMIEDNNANRTGGNVIILGSGFDTRCYRFQDQLKEAKINCFEIDAPGTLAIKRQVLTKQQAMHSIETSHVAYCSCDFETQDWLQQLTQIQADNGSSSPIFDPSLPTCIIWEGVTMYLSESTIRRSLKQVADMATQHNASWYIAFDYAASEWAKIKMWDNAMSYAKEPFQFTIPTDVSTKVVTDLCRDCGIQVFEHIQTGEADEELKSLYVPIRRGYNGGNNEGHPLSPPMQQHVGIMGNYGGFVVAGKIH